MAGLYETAIEALAVREVDGRTIKPKIVASTATARRAQDQVQALFARPMTQVFPPPGPDRRDTFFAGTVPSSETPARLYVGIASQGRNPKVLMRRVQLALMGAAALAWHEGGADRNPRNPADPYMTTLAYFNSLRELGGARRILEEEVSTTVARYGARRRIGETQRLFRDRATFSEVLELTSRVSTDKVAEARRRLECPFNDRDNRVDCALATNMISVGLDIPRLGLMLVLGQPKMHAEYIQATSRVGRSDDSPGLVVTLLNVHKPRDRSHYERFRHYHETFYRSVEPASVTPFSARALDRGFAGALVALARHLEPALTPPRGVERIADVRTALESRLLHAFVERVGEQAFSEDEREEGMRSVQDRVGDLLDSWRRVLDDYHGDGVQMQYQRYELRQPKPLLREMLEERFESEHHRKFRANRSLRDVEPEVNLYLHDLRAPRSVGGRVKRKAHGQVRPSQVITTYGPGALIDLPQESAIVAGTRRVAPGAQAGGDRRAAARAKAAGGHRRHHGATAGAPARVVRSQRGADRHRRMALSRSGSSSRPRMHGEGTAHTRSRRLVPRKALDNDKHCFEGRDVVATRFVRGCPRGHVDDLDWRRFVHRRRQRVPADPTAVARRAGDDRGPDGSGGPLRVRCDAAPVGCEHDRDQSARARAGERGRGSGATRTRSATSRAGSWCARRPMPGSRRC